MNDWISKLRLQKARLELKEGGRTLQSTAPQQGWRQPRSSLFLAFFAGVSVLLLKHGHHLPVTWNAAFAIFGDSFLVVITLMIGATFLRALTSSTFRSRHQAILLLIILAILTLIPIRLLPLTGGLWPSFLTHDSLIFLFPLGLAPLLAVLLLSPSAALVLGLWTACIAALLTGNNFTVLLFGLLQTGMIVSLTRRVRRRSHLLKIGLLTGLSLIYGAVAQNIAVDGAPSTLLLHVLFCLANGLFTAIASVLLLPLLESVFDLTSPITLSDLADLGQPLLQRLALEAPGTYHHCLVVANLAQSAAQTIGANALLVQAGAYYHDIGKLGKAGLYTENMQAQDNPHDEFSPNMSALLITSHVKEGVSLALLCKLPRTVIDIIKQHHGTGLVAFFLHKAKIQNENEKKREGRPGFPGSATPVNESDFRYPGPKPQSREAAIVMIADAVEAASRALAKPTPNHIRDLISDIIRGKLLDGQFDECGLTLAELNRLRESFIFTLTSMFHSRIAYPKDESHPAQPSAN
jgi:putative nucleotidyltransferase with HDIG domain